MNIKRGYACRIVGILSLGNVATVEQLRLAVGCSRQMAFNVLRRMHAQGAIEKQDGHPARYRAGKNFSVWLGTQGLDPWDVYWEGEYWLKNQQAQRAQNNQNAPNEEEGTQHEGRDRQEARA